MENQPIYTASAPSDLAAFKFRPCAKRFADPGYTPPTAAEVKALIKLAGWSQNDVAKLVGVAFDPTKGSSVVRRWCVDESKDHHRPISYSSWRLMLIYAGVVDS